MSKAATFFRTSAALLLRLYAVCWLIMILGMTATLLGISLRALNPFYVPLLFLWLFFVTAAAIHSSFAFSKFVLYAIHWLVITPHNLVLLILHTCGINWRWLPKSCSATWINLSTKQLPGIAFEFMLVMGLGVMPSLGSQIATMPHAHTVATTLSYAFWIIVYFVIIGAIAAFHRITSEAKDSKDAVMRMGSALLPASRRSDYEVALTTHIDTADDADSTIGVLRFHWYAFISLFYFYWSCFIDPARDIAAMIRKEVRKILKNFQNRP